jgi:hypothetical protein
MNTNIEQRTERTPSFIGVSNMRYRIKKVSVSSIVKRKGTKEESLYNFGKNVIKSYESDTLKQKYIMENAIENNCEAVLIISKSTLSAGCISMHVAKNIGYIYNVLYTIKDDSLFEKAENLYVYGKLYMILLDDDIFIDLPNSTLNKFFDTIRDEKYPSHFTNIEKDNVKEFISRLGGLNKGVFPLIEQIE